MSLCHVIRDQFQLPSILSEDEDAPYAIAGTSRPLLSLYVGAAILISLVVF